MKRTRRKHSPEFKAKVGMEALKEQKTLTELSQNYSLHANQICDWKKTITEHAHTLFGGGRDTGVHDVEAVTAPLYQQIGQLKVELDFLKKKLKQLGQA